MTAAADATGYHTYFTWLANNIQRVRQTLVEYCGFRMLSPSLWTPVFPSLRAIAQNTVVLLNDKLALEKFELLIKNWNKITVQSPLILIKLQMASVIEPERLEQIRTNAVIETENISQK